MMKVATPTRPVRGKTCKLTEETGTVPAALRPRDRESSTDFSADRPALTMRHRPARYAQFAGSLLAGALLACAPHVFAGEPIPVEDFARTPHLTGLQLSLGGSRIGYVREVRGQRRLFVADVTRLEQPQEVRLETDREERRRRSVAAFQWISDERLLITTAIAGGQLYGVFAVNWNGARRVAISGNELGEGTDVRFFATEALYAFEDDAPSILMVNDRTRFGDAMLYPDVVRVDTRTAGVSPVLKNPGNVVVWGVDFVGDVRLGITSDATAGLKFGATYRDTTATPWRTLLEPVAAADRIRPLDFDARSGQLYVATWSAARRTAVHQFDPATGRLGPELVSDPVYDVVPDNYTPSFAGVGLGDTVTSLERGGIVGVRYCTDRIAVRWFDAGYAARQAAIDALLPATVNIVCGATRAEDELLVLAFSDRHPGAFLLFDAHAGTMRLLGERMPWLDPQMMAPMEPIRFRARDGLEIHGYLTLPPGLAAGVKPPLVVVPHGGPAARDIWSFDAFVQLLASRGYAVLQPDFRGSTGYGRDFFAAGQREAGGKIQDDIADATRWAMASGRIDPDRVAIVGVSFGGYSALFALGHDPQLYRCGVAIAAVTDWMGIFAEGASRPELALAHAYWSEQIGDPAGDEVRLRAVSPVNFAGQITAPVLLIHGRDDRNVPVQQARAMIAALTRAGHKPESLLLAEEGHTFKAEKKRAEAFTRVVAFLEKHLAAPRAP